MGRSQIFDGSKWVPMTGGVSGDGTGGGDLDITYLRLDNSNNNLAPYDFMRRQDTDAAYLSLNGTAVQASKWATARTISLGGDLSGSASFDGSANFTLSAQVSNDSHTHDTRYFTETEADGRFLKLTGGTISGALTVSGALTLRTGAFISNYNPAPPGGSEVYFFQVRNIIMSDLDASTGKGEKNGDVWLRYSWS